MSRAGRGCRGVRVAGLIAAGCIAASAVHASGAPRLSFTSLGTVRIGMTEAALSAALGSPLEHEDPDGDERCRYVTAAGLPESVNFMLRSGRLARIDVFGPGVVTVSGAQYGTLEHDLERLYGPRLERTPHAHAWPEGHYLTLRSPDGRHGIRFETDGQAVTGFYAGTQDALELTEGCQ